jgi:hypothetical protein
MAKEVPEKVPRRDPRKDPRKVINARSSSPILTQPKGRGENRQIQSHWQKMAPADRKDMPLLSRWTCH